LTLGAFIIPRDGIIYVSTGAKFVTEVVASAERVRQVMPNIPITLFTNQPFENPLFENVVLLQNLRREHADKILGLQRSPYERTLYIDSDIYIIEDISDVFAILDQFDLAIAHDPNRIRLSFKAWWSRVPYAFTQMNAGLIAVKKSAVTDEFLADWSRLYHEYLAMYSLETSFDQPAFREALYFSRARIATLPPEYNFRPSYVGYVNERVKVLHDRHPKLAQFAQAINRQAHRRVIYVRGNRMTIMTNRPRWSDQRQQLRRYWKRIKRRILG
jgi:hypothetical protein